MTNRFVLTKALFVYENMEKVHLMLDLPFFTHSMDYILILLLPINILYFFFDYTCEQDNLDCIHFCAFAHVENDLVPLLFLFFHS